MVFLMPEILITGATGFIGKAVVHRLLDENRLRTVAVAVRRDVQQLTSRVVSRVTGDLEPTADWSAALEGILAVVHCAARVHVMVDKSGNPLEEFRRVNVHGTLNLARQSAAAGVKRFVFVSSIKVNGETTRPVVPFMACDKPAPLDAYGISKMEAEQGLHEIARQTDMEVVIIRPPLVYGPGVKANFAAMMRWLKFGFPLPLGAIHNQRSLVALDNLVDLISTCLSHPAAANQTFLVSDGEDVSTTELLQRMSASIGWPARLIPVPASWLENVAAIVGKKDVARRLCGSLQVDIEKTRNLLDWTPPLTLDEGLKKAAKGLRV
ncbi:MAG TPA: NAD-dependent dehydratase [Gammaproteobacteria bacterium]|nr:NAD-dependent dehydratase [Gammaproteobacteria bacterium]